MGISYNSSVWHTSMHSDAIFCCDLSCYCHKCNSWWMNHKNKKNEPERLIDFWQSFLFHFSLFKSAFSYLFDSAEFQEKWESRDWTSVQKGGYCTEKCWEANHEWCSRESCYWDIPCFFAWFCLIYVSNVSWIKLK